METVEMWMWIIAGMVVAGIVLVASYSFLAKYIYTNEIKQAEKSFDALVNTIHYSCLGGYSRETKDITLPFIMKELYVINKQTNIKGEGNRLCMVIEKEFCNKLECNVSMNTLRTKEKRSVFYLIRKIAGKRSVRLRFTITNLGNNIEINWTRILNNYD